MKERRKIKGAGAEEGREESFSTGDMNTLYSQELRV